MAFEDNLIFHGAPVKASELWQFIEHILRVNLQAEAAGKHRTPLCIWGRHGIGKSALVKDFAETNNYEFVYISPAQFEEMGDLLGMPAIQDGKTVFQPPVWVPQTQGPGILLIDDLNRADDRILRGLMPLLQYQELSSWQLPPKWQIICTANPDGGDYSVTPLDDAILTRMMHVSLTFDVKEWAEWAEKQFIDPRGINFLLTYPETITGEKTTARTLVQFFEAIHAIEDLSAQLDLVQMLGDACLDEITVSHFIAFIQQGLANLLSPKEILGSEHFDAEIRPKITAWVKKEPLRVDILSTICTRLVNYAKLQETTLKQIEIDNLKAFLKLDFLPNDLRFALARDLIHLKNKGLEALLADPEIGKMYMERI